jgi:hypothetical protein
MKRPECGIKAGDVVKIKPKWQDAGDSKWVWIALEDESGGRVLISPQMGLPLNPCQRVDRNMLE